MPTHSTDLSENILLLLGKLDGKMDTVVAQGESHSHRIASLEAWRNKLIGIAMVVGTGAGALGSKIASTLAGISFPTH